MKKILFLMVYSIIINNILSAQTTDSVSAGSCHHEASCEHGPSCTHGCSCADENINPSGIMLGHEHARGSWMVSYRYMHSAMRGAIEEAHKVDSTSIFNQNYVHAPEYMNMDMHMLMGMYGFTDRFSLMVMLNFNVMDMGMNMFGNAHNHTSTTSGAISGLTSYSAPSYHSSAGASAGHHSSANKSADMTMSSKGLGDTELYAMYKLLSKEHHCVFPHLGISIPTGNINVKGKANDLMYPSLRYPYMMQLGSGTVDLMPGGTYLMNYNNLLLGAQATSVIRPFQSKYGYRRENRLNLNFWAAYKWLNWLSNSIRVEDIYSSSVQGRDTQVSTITEPAGNPDNYGGQNVNIYGGVNFYINKTFLKNSKLLVEYGIPTYQYANGIQLRLKSQIYAGWYFLF